VSEELSPEALQDLQNGNLGDLLKKELMILRIKHACDLTEYVKYAELSRQPEIADYCRNLNPTTIPREIREQAVRPHPATAEV
jgi:hypothetical protein